MLDNTNNFGRGFDDDDIEDIINDFKKFRITVQKDPSRIPYDEDGNFCPEMLLKNNVNIKK